MGAQLGRLLILKAQDAAGSPTNFARMPGLQVVSYAITSPTVDADTKESEWVPIVEGGSGRRMRLRASGTTEDSATEALLETRAGAGTIAEYQIQRPNGNIWQGRFMIVSFEVSADRSGDNVERYTVELASDGEPQFIEQGSP